MLQGEQVGSVCKGLCMQYYHTWTLFCGQSWDFSSRSYLWSRKNSQAGVWRLIHKEDGWRQGKIGNLECAILLHGESENRRNKMTWRAISSCILFRPFLMSPSLLGIFASSVLFICLAFTYTDFWNLLPGQSVDATGWLPCPHLTAEANFSLEQEPRFDYSH